MKRSQILKALIFLSIFVVHSVGQFLAFGYADSPVRSSGSMRIIWNILATPLFYVTASLANYHFWAKHYFWVVGIANSVLWAAILTYLIARFALKR